ncbi:Protein-L-isoaspartate O-methyltransferase [Roseibium album]|nr:Protein-L-isoaspartate O-methyltransferase [Roseibium album]
MDQFATKRKEMVLQQLERRGIQDARVLAAMAKVPRHLFVTTDQDWQSYSDRPLPIGHRQTISQPYIVALMCEALKLTEKSKTLEIGTGSGYAAAVMAELSGHVTSIERIPELADLARENLRIAGYPSIEIHCSDGSLGYPENAPYDAIAVASGAPAAPETLKQQLSIGGRLIVPVGTSRTYQDLLKISRITETDYKTENLGAVAFVPLVGKEGWLEEI